jgi:hypothetical protein
MREYKSGNEFLPYHPSASHTPPDFRDGWNSCFSEAEIRITELKSQVEALRKDAERLDWIIDNASSRGGGNGFTLKVFVPVDCECVRTAIDAAIKGEQA